MKPQSLLLAAESVPHYINFQTRLRVLRSYRELHRNLDQLPDTFARRHLKSLAQHSFARFKFVTNPRKIEALLDFAETHEFQWASLAAQGYIKDIFRVLEIAFTTHGVKETPMRHILAKPPKLCDHTQLCYRLNNVPMPGIRTFDDHKSMMSSVKAKPFPEVSGAYWQLTKIMLQNNFKTGKHRRKLHFSPEDIINLPVTVFGKPIAQKRQGNTLKRLYTKFLRDAPRPVHPEVLDHISIQSKCVNLPRKYRRRYKELANQLFTLNESGTLCKIDPFDY